MRPRTPAKKTPKPKARPRKKPTKGPKATQSRKGIDDMPEDMTRPPWPPP